MSSAQTTLTPLTDLLDSLRRDLAANTAATKALEGKMGLLRKEVDGLEQVKKHRGELIKQLQKDSKQLKQENEKLDQLSRSQTVRIAELKDASESQQTQLDSLLTKSLSSRKRDRSQAPGPDSPRVRPKVEDDEVQIKPDADEPALGPSPAKIGSTSILQTPMS